MNKKKLTAGMSVAVAAGTMLVGSALTSAAIASPEADLPEVAELVTQDASGDWYSCAVDLEGSSAVIGVTVSVPEGDASAQSEFVEAEAIPAGDVTVAHGDSGIVGVTGSVGPEEIADLPSADEIRPGTEEECSLISVTGP